MISLVNASARLRAALRADAELILLNKLAPLFTGSEATRASQKEEGSKEGGETDSHGREEEEEGGCKTAEENKEGTANHEAPHQENGREA